MGWQRFREAHSKQASCFDRLIWVLMVGEGSDRFWKCILFFEEDGFYVTDTRLCESGSAVQLVEPRDQMYPVGGDCLV